MKIIEDLYEPDKLNKRLNEKSLDKYDFLILLLAIKSKIIPFNEKVILELNNYVYSNKENLVPEIFQIFRKDSDLKDLINIFKENKKLISELYQFLDVISNQESKELIINLTKEKNVEILNLKKFSFEELNEKLIIEERRTRLDKYNSESDIGDYLLSNMTIIENNQTGIKYFDKKLYDYRKEIFLEKIKDSKKTTNGLEMSIIYLIIDICKKIKTTDDTIIFKDYSKLENFNSDKLELLDSPEKLREKTGEKKVKKAIYVVNENNEIIIYGREIGESQITVHHTDLSKWKKVKTAGELLFNENNEIICITNGSGHYTPPLESLNHIKKTLIDKKVDISKIVFCDVSFEHLLKPEIKINHQTLLNNIKDLRKLTGSEPNNSKKYTKVC